MHEERHQLRTDSDLRQQVYFDQAKLIEVWRTRVLHAANLLLKSGCAEILNRSGCIVRSVLLLSVGLVRGLRARVEQDCVTSLVVLTSKI